MEPRPITRRAFLADLGRGAVAIAVVGLAGCGPSAQATSPATNRATSRPTTPAASAPPTEPAGTADAGSGDLRWERVNLGFVSAYLLVRGGEAALVDTGVEGSADAIERSLAAIGLGWWAVAHLILTHHHADHAGSAAEVFERAPQAMAYAGAEDIPLITVPRPATAVSDGDMVFDLEIVTTPGHTAGSICVLDTAGGVLVAGDALSTDGGRPALPSPQFTDDMDQAIQSVAKIGGLTFETLLVGHGDPIESGAAAAVAELAAQQ